MELDPITFAAVGVIEHFKAKEKAAMLGMAETMFEVMCPECRAQFIERLRAMGGAP